MTGTGPQLAGGCGVPGGGLSRGGSGVAGGSASPPTIVAATVARTSTPAVPTGTAEGDVLVAVIGFAYNSDTGAAADWDLTLDGFAEIEALAEANFDTLAAMSVLARDVPAGYGPLPAPVIVAPPLTGFDNYYYAAVTLRGTTLADLHASAITAPPASSSDSVLPIEVPPNGLGLSIYFQRLATNPTDNPAPWTTVIEASSGTGTDTSIGIVFATSVAGETVSGGDWGSASVAQPHVRAALSFAGSS